MKNKLFAILLPHIVDGFLSQFPEKLILEYIDDLIVSLEDRIKASPSEIDDALLPVLQTIKTLFGLPDMP